MIIINPITVLVPVSENAYSCCFFCFFYRTLRSRPWQVSVLRASEENGRSGWIDEVLEQAGGFGAVPERRGYCAEVRKLPYALLELYTVPQQCSGFCSLVLMF